MISSYQEEVKDHFKKELSHIDLGTFTEEEITRMGMASEQGDIDWDHDTDGTRTQWETWEEASYSYFFAAYEDIVASSEYKERNELCTISDCSCSKKHYRGWK